MTPSACATMLIRRPVTEVFEAFLDPRVTRRFWFSSGSDRLRPGAYVTWRWDTHGVSREVHVLDVEPCARILVEWPTPVEWVFSPRGAEATMVRITASGFTGTIAERVAQAIDSMGGFCFVLAGCKAFLEHGVELHLVRDHDPGARIVGE